VYVFALSYPILYFSIAKEKEKGKGKGKGKGTNWFLSFLFLPLLFSYNVSLFLSSCLIYLR
jgi:hypothetical protein